MSDIAERIGAIFARQGPRALQLRTSTAASRIARLKRLRAVLLANRTRLHEAFHRDFRKPAAEVDLSELVTTLDEIGTAVRNLRAWMRPVRVRPTLATIGTSARVLHQPRGRCLIIGPWNYPLATVIGPLVSAIAAGNTVIVKPSEFTPSVNGVLRDILATVFPEDEAAMVEGGVETAQALLELPFDHVFFTGSPAVGRIVMAAAAKHLASVTLELGGKSPALVDASADVDAAARMILWGKLLNAGQTCVAPDTLYVHADIRDAFVAACRRIIAERYGDSDALVRASTDLARMIHESHAARLGRLIDDAVEKGATALIGGGYEASERYVAPTLLADTPSAAAIAQEEIFGPVLPLHAFTDIGEVVARINNGPKPLALYLWSRSRSTVDRVLAETASGGAVVNHCLMQFAHTGLPFGGVGQSGMGSAHGYAGFKAFSHERAYLRGGRLAPIRLMMPPYRPSKLWLTRMLLRLVGRA